ncbi:hypothetical protein WICPIJ_004285 [Wickerhamomyces pijperi]|uniref:Uncharacterized protein n=1 Tax=Wickerhamomyces pijperi TaxID=599730 RepID=A0A9P8TN26_WICPI|nr:hypothetical protein WICPIJ_004285 [Wickerhamomyces pijperi]
MVAMTAGPGSVTKVERKETGVTFVSSHDDEEHQVFLYLITILDSYGMIVESYHANIDVAAGVDVHNYEPCKLLEPVMTHRVEVSSSSIDLLSSKFYVEWGVIHHEISRS